MFIYAVVTCHKIFKIFIHFVNLRKIGEHYAGFLIESVDTLQTFGFVDVGKRKEIRIKNFYLIHARNVAGFQGFIHHCTEVQETIGPIPYGR